MRTKVILFFFYIMLSINGQADVKLGVYERPDLYWMQVSNEYENVTKSLYNLAKIQLNNILQNREQSAFLEQKLDKNFHLKNLPSAIIMDIDETILNNSSFAVYMQTELKNEYSSKDWNNFVKKEISYEVAGSVNFINYALNHGVRVFLVSNRNQSQLDATFNNLKKIGVKIPKNQIMLIGGKSNWDTNKYLRYREIGEKYYIAMIIGDNMTDFFPPFSEDLTYKEYKKLNKKYESYIGKYWIQLPAPTYGSWQEILGVSKQIKSFKNK